MELKAAIAKLTEHQNMVKETNEKLKEAEALVIKAKQAKQDSKDPKALNEFNARRFSNF